MRALFSRIAGLLWRARLDRRLDDEVEFHLAMLEQQFRRRGLTEREAHAAALRSFGGVIQMKETYREQGGLPWIETFVLDARYGIRTLLRAPGFTLAALVTLALGIGANSAIFSVVHAVLLQPPPYGEPERIVEMHRNTGGLQNGHTFVRYNFYRETLESFDAFAAWRRVALNLVAGDAAEYVSGLAVSQEYFSAMGGSPVYGRVFEPNEDVPNGPDVVILSHPLWRRMFASSPAAIGQTVSLGDKPYTLVGVMPEGFDSARPAEFYVPLRPGPTGPGGGFNYRIVARLKRGVTRQQANAEAAAAFTSFKAALPDAIIQKEEPPQFLTLQDSLSRGVRPALLMMLGAVGMVLAIACANTANLLLARASGRGREIAVRAALGAAKGRIVRQLLTESVVLFLCGGTLGIALAYWSMPALLSLTPAAYLPGGEVTVSGFVLLVSLCISLVTGILFGLVPALSLSRFDLTDAFKDDGTRTTSSRRSNWMRHSLVVAEVTLCMLLLVGAASLIQTFRQLRAVDLGFDPTNVLTARMSLMGERYASSEAVNRLYAAGLERIRKIPGVQMAAAVNGVPIDYGLNLNFDRLDTPEVEHHLTDWRYTTPDYFATLGIAIVEGRGFTERDDQGAPRVAVVSQRFAKLYYKDKNPIGQDIVLFKPDGPIRIVGIARDLREAGLRGAVPAVMYVPVAQAGDAAVRAAHMYFQVSWVIRAAGLTPELTARIREELRAVDPKQPITAFRSIDNIRSRAMTTETFQMALLTTFATIGLVLAAAGIYGVITYTVAQRTREFGIRMALGATERQLMGSVLRQGALLGAVGIVLGTLASAALARALQSFIVDLSSIDVATTATVALTLFVVAILASLVPAIRALRLNPVTALRR